MLKNFKKLYPYSRFLLKKIKHLGDNTYCPSVWDSLYINPAGDVFVCCYYKPSFLGNIYKQDLRHIWEKNKKLRIYRWMSLHRCLDYLCWKGCIRMSKVVKDAKAREAYLEYPRILDITYGEICNLKCIMCRQGRNPNTTLDINVLKRNVDWSRIQEIMLQGGEVLAMEDAKEFFLWLTKEMNKKVNLVTNGMLINEEWADYLVKGSGWIMVSVNAATEKTHEFINRNSRFKTVIDNIRRLIDCKIKNNSGCKILYKYTIVKENVDEIAEAIGLADGLGCDAIIFGHDYLIGRLFKENEELRNRIRRELAAALKNKNLKIRLYRNELEFLGLLDSHPA